METDPNIMPRIDIIPGMASLRRVGRTLIKFFSIVETPNTGAEVMLSEQLEFDYNGEA